MWGRPWNPRLEAVSGGGPTDPSHNVMEQLERGLVDPEKLVLFLFQHLDARECQLENVRSFSFRSLNLNVGDDV